MIEGRAKLQSNANFQRRSQTMHDDDEKHNFSWEAKENWIFKPFYRQTKASHFVLFELLRQKSNIFSGKKSQYCCKMRPF